jgi:hypothetical protein
MLAFEPQPARPAYCSTGFEVRTAMPPVVRGARTRRACQARTICTPPAGLLLIVLHLAILIRIILSWFRVNPANPGSSRPHCTYSPDDEFRVKTKLSNSMWKLSMLSLTGSYCQRDGAEGARLEEPSRDRGEKRSEREADIDAREL